MEGDPTYVKSVYAYDGLDDQELSFPAECYIRLLRKNIVTARNQAGRGEEWWEGAYENKIGFFPAIFVVELGAFDDAKSAVVDPDPDETLLHEPAAPMEQSPSLKEELDAVAAAAIATTTASPPTQNQQVPGWAEIQLFEAFTGL